MVADLEAVAVGVNIKLTVQVAFGATVAPEQLSELVTKSTGFVPPSVIVEMIRLAVPVSVTVSAFDCDELVVPLPGEMATPKDRLFDERVNTGLPTAIV
jgi:hypothetical protein